MVWIKAMKWKKAVDGTQYNYAWERRLDNKNIDPEFNL
jgi:hypothetical protein